MGSPQPAKVSLIGDFLLSYLGYFILLPILPVLLSDPTVQLSPLIVGVILGAFNVSVRGASLLCSSWLHRSSPSRAIACGLLTASLGFAICALFYPKPLGLTVGLVTSGIGISINSIMVRVYVAATVDNDVPKQRMFSVLQIAINLGAAVGPILGNFLLDSHHFNRIFWFIALAYAVAAMWLIIFIPYLAPRQDSTERSPLGWGLIRDIVHEPTSRLASIAAIVGGLLYAQLFSSITLHNSIVESTVSARSRIFVVNAIMVVIAQGLVTQLVTRLLKKGTTPLKIVGGGIILFAGSLTILGLCGGSTVGLVLAVVIFSLAETVFTPTVNTAFSSLPGERPLIEVFNMRQASVTIGESLGTFIGGSFFLAIPSEMRLFYWLGLSVLGCLAFVYIWWGNKKILSNAQNRIEQENAHS